jgi:hypothetical protein
MPKRTFIAKITCPRFQDVLPRKRLFGLLDKGIADARQRKAMASRLSVWMPQFWA